VAADDRGGWPDRLAAVVSGRLGYGTAAVVAGGPDDADVVFPWHAAVVVPARDWACGLGRAVGAGLARQAKPVVVLLVAGDDDRRYVDRARRAGRNLVPRPQVWVVDTRRDELALDDVGPVVPVG